MEKSTSESRRDSWALQILSFLIAAVLLASLIRIADFDAILSVLAQVDRLWYLFGVGLFLCSYVAATWRWMELGRSVGYEIGFSVAFEIVSISYSLNLLLPANAGDLLRSKLVAQYHKVKSQTEVLSLVVVGRVMDFVVTVGLFILASLFVGVRLLSTDLLIIGLVFVAATLLAVFGITRIPVFPLGQIPETVKRQLQIGTQTVRGLTKRRLASVALLTIVSWLFVVSAFLVLAGALGVTVGIPVALATVTGVSLMAILPLTPGGIGVGDTVAVAILIAGGLDRSTSVALALLYRSLSIIWSAPLGIVLYLNRFPFSRT